MNSNTAYDVAVVGGGLAGLTLAIQLADAGLTCVVFEKNKFPFHKVCGEYVSMESFAFLERCGVELSKLDLPVIKKLIVSSPSGKTISQNLDVGGFGISRYLLDSTLAAIATNKGVCVMDGCRVDDVVFDKNRFRVITNAGVFESEICAGAWGKKSKMDVTLGRKFIATAKKEKNYVGVKYHVTIDLPDDTIELHNFENGYCGISKIENGKYCLCYLTDSENLKAVNGDIKMMEEKFLFRNPFLSKYFTTAAFAFAEPLTISQIKIGIKNTSANEILMLGDAAGNIAPLSGNGMSMAMRSSFELNKLIVRYFKKEITRNQLATEYDSFWNAQFKRRIRFSAVLQTLLKKTILTELFFVVLKLFPIVKKKIVRVTHGNPY